MINTEKLSGRVNCLLHMGFSLQQAVEKSWEEYKDAEKFRKTVKSWNTKEEVVDGNK